MPVPIESFNFKKFLSWNYLPLFSSSHCISLSYIIHVYIIPSKLYTIKALLSPQGVYLILDTSEGGLLERGNLFTKSSDRDIFGNFSVLLSHILWNQHTIYGSIHKFDTVCLPNHIKINMQGCVAKQMENIW